MMDFLRGMARSIMGPQREPDNSPTAEDRDDAQDIDELIQNEDVWEVGEEMGTIPQTPKEGEYYNTDPRIETAKKPDPWYRQFFPW